MSNNIYAIDIGTTQVRIGKHEEVLLVTPNYISFRSDGEYLIGEDAKAREIESPSNTINGWQLTHLIGSKLDHPSIQRLLTSTNYISQQQQQDGGGEPVVDYQRFESRFPLKIVANKSNRPLICVVDNNNEAPVREKALSPEYILSLFLTKMISTFAFIPSSSSASSSVTASLSSSMCLSEVVISVPAYFTYEQRRGVLKACNLARLTVHQIINKSTAAAFAVNYFIQEELLQKMNESNSSKSKKEMKDEDEHKEGVNGDTNNSISSVTEDPSGVNINDSQIVLVFDFGFSSLDISLVVLDDGICKVKGLESTREFSGDEMDTRLMRWLVNNKDQSGQSLGKRFEESMKRSSSEREFVLRRLRAACQEAKVQLSMASEISIPFFQEDLREEGGVSTNGSVTISKSDFDTACGSLFQKTLPLTLQSLLDHTQYRVDEIQKVIVTGGVGAVPAVTEKLRDMFEPRITINFQYQRQLLSLNGCAHQGALLSGYRFIDSLLLLDVYPFNIGVETAPGLYTTLIAKHTPVPVKKTFSVKLLNKSLEGNGIVFYIDGKSITTTSSITYDTPVGWLEIDSVLKQMTGVIQLEVHCNNKLSVSISISRADSKDKVVGNLSSLSPPPTFYVPLALEIEENEERTEALTPQVALEKMSISKIYHS